MFDNGCEWIRCDFHLHTRKDKEFKYTGEDNSFVSDYVNKLESEKIKIGVCLLYTSPSPRDRTRSRMPSSA